MGRRRRQPGRGRGAAGEDDVATREYRHGDDLRRVHWRSTARHGELMVRREEQPWQSRARSCSTPAATPTAARARASSFEWAVSAAASIGVHLAREGLGLRLVTDQGAEHLTDAGLSWSLLDTLAVVRTSQARSLEYGISALRQGGGDGLIVAVLGGIDLEEATAAGQAQARQRHRRRRAARRGAPGSVPSSARPRNYQAAQAVLAGDRAGASCGCPRAPRSRGVAGRRATRAIRSEQGRLMRLPLASGVATGAVAIALYPLFQGGSWFWTSLGIILVVTGVGVLASRYTLPNWLAPLAQLAAAAIYLTAVFTGEQAWAKVVPTKDSVVGLGELLSTGFTDIQRFAAPVPDSVGIVLLTCGGVGLIAILVDLLASRLRRAALTGLPLLALFTVPAAVVVEPISWPAFIIGALGYLALLVADGRERVSHWGRTVLVRRTPSFVAPRPATSDTGALRLSGKRIGVTAIVLAVLLPSLLPTLEPDPLFGFGVGNGRGGGGNSISIPNPIVNLRGQLSLPDNSTVLTYTISDSSPRYLRMYSLDTFDGDQWTMSEPKGRPGDRTSRGRCLGPRPGRLRGPPRRRPPRSTVERRRSGRLSFLPLPYPATPGHRRGRLAAPHATRSWCSPAPGTPPEGLTYEG